jgi:hypothetical protein
MSKFQFLPPIFNFLILIILFSKFSFKLPHLTKVLLIFTPSRIFELFYGWVQVVWIWKGHDEAVVDDGRDSAPAIVETRDGEPYYN